MITQEVDSVKIRMYHTGSVGDCLLLLFMKNNTVSFRMLVDCGGWNTNKNLIGPVADHIKATCGALDLLVITHQHEDHISGFNQARQIFDTLPVNEVWMSWIEDKTDEVGIILKEKYGKKLRQLRAQAEKALTGLRAAARRHSTVRQFSARLKMKEAAIKDTLNLISFEEGKEYGRKLGAGRRTNEDAMTWLKKKGNATRYCIPGEVIDNLPGAEGLQFYVLGPPRDEDMRYFKINVEDEEMYHLSADGRANAAAKKSDRLVQSGITLKEGVSPFSSEFIMTGREEELFQKLYHSREYSWRQIETDWMESAASIALRVTALTNNTSLALAIEFKESGKVILLPGDAQSGNWMGWHKEEVMKQLKENGGKDTTELLKHTVFYKVGHHGSHNGTASKSGLDLVPDKDLVAFLPLVQEKVPKEWGGANNFPGQELYGVLINKTKGRIVRTDEGVATDPRAVKLRSLLSTAEKKAFLKSVTHDDLYVEYTLRTR